MRIGSVQLQMARKIVEVFKARITILRTPGRKLKVSSTQTADMSGITAYLVVGFELSVLTIITSLGALLALMLMGLHLLPTSTSIELFRECATGALLSELISVLRRHRPRR
jgi:hypothetical protein